MGEFLMPSLGADMDAGTLLEWHVKPGDAVKHGDIVALVDTNKAEIEVEIFEDGVIDQLLVQEGMRVPVGTVLATVRAVGVEAPAPPLPEAQPPRETAPPPEAPPPPEAAPLRETAPPPEAPPLLETAPPPEAPPLPETPPPEAPAASPEVAPPVTAPAMAAPPIAPRARISPLARRAAERMGIDVTAISGSGPRGAITLADVEHSVPSAPVPQAAGTSPIGADGSRQDAMRHAIGALMARSKREIPHYHLQLEIDLARALAWLHEANIARPVEQRVLPSALLLSAVARAAADMPEMNGFWIDDTFRPGSGIHLGVAVSLRGGGLIAPALHDADRRTVDELMTGVRDLVQRARTGRLRSSEMSDPTLTVTNLGERGVDLVHGVIYPPQVALVGFGAIRERPWAVDGMLGVRPTVIATLAADHRASDGHTGGLFLSRIEHNLQNPEEL